MTPPTPFRITHSCVLAPALSLVLLLAAPAAFAGMYKYVDSQGRLHFTQDIGQVPPEYRDQVERKELKRDISITGQGGGSSGDRVQQMEQRRKRLQKAAKERTRKASPPAAPARRKHPLEGAPEPQKYTMDCSRQYETGRCRRYRTAQWDAWNAANGGDNGKPVTRRKIGDRGKD